MVGPLFILLLVGAVVYGGWFWLAQSVQHLASEGARAAVAGLDEAERETLARAAISGGVAQGSGIQAAHAVVDVAVKDEATVVTVSYDASNHPLMALASLVPSPPRTIVRSSVIRTGGY